MTHHPRYRLAAAAIAAVAGLSVAFTTFAQEALPTVTPLTRPATLPANAGLGEAARGDTAEAYQTAVQAFATESGQLAPDAAARRWLDLFDRAAKLDAELAERARADNHFYRSDSTQFHALLNALPGPAAWDALARAIEARPLPKFKHELPQEPEKPEKLGFQARARFAAMDGSDPALREHGLRLMAAALVNDQAGQAASLKALQGYAARQDAQQYQYTIAGQSIEQLSQALTGKPAAPGRMLKQFEEQLAAGPAEGSNGIEVPPLVTVIGAERAEALLRKALVGKTKLNFGPRFDTDHDDGTRRLARKLAVELAAKMKRAPWELVDVAEVSEVPSSIALYEAMDARFPAVRGKRGPALLDQLFGRAKNEWELEQDQQERDLARNAYLVCLIIAGRGEDAAKLAAARAEGPADADGDGFVDPLEEVRAGIKHDFQFTQVLAQAADARRVYAALTVVLREQPALPLWDVLRESAVKIGKVDEALALAREVAARPGLSPDARRAVRTELYKGLLAADAVDEGIAVLRELVKRADVAPAAAGAVPPVNGPRRGSNEQTFDHDKRGESAAALARLGVLLKRPELVDEGVKTIRDVLAAAQKTAAEEDHGDDYERHSLVAQLAELLSDAGRAGDAAQLLSDEMSQARALQAKRDADPNNRFSHRNADDRQDLLALMAVYHRAGRHADLREMLDATPYWNAADLAAFYAAPTGHASAGEIAAAALLAGGRTDDARRIIDAVLDASPGSDAAYQLLLRAVDVTTPAGAAEAIKRLDTLFARDRFEERPLIWKAVVLRGQKKTDEAERALRQAIAIDPSDGEQGKGDRMRAYAVLADVLEDKGDAKNAAFFRGVVSAIRMSEDADDYYAAGLLSRGVAMYQESLKHFQDAYCIQSRLAVQLAEMGMTGLAAQHYRRAFELMPDSFGRMESHCFACEGAFRGNRAQEIADAVFGDMLARHPERPQLHYLLAYLREQQDRYADALPLLRQAVRLDPDYINAWKHILDLADNTPVPAADADAAMLNLIRLDPLARHGRPEPKSVRDLKSLWAAAEAAAKLQTPPPTKLYPLAASAAELAKAPKPENGPADDAFAGAFDNDQARLTPSRLIWSTDVMEAAGGLIGGN